MTSRMDIRRLMQAGRKAEALSQLVAAVQCAAPDRDARLTLARLANELGPHALAAEHARALTGVDSRDSEAWSALGTAEFGLRHPRQALDALRRAVEISPAYGSARANLAAVLADQEHAEEALIHADEARRHGVKPRGVALIEARALIQLDRFDEAERLLLSQLAGDPQDVGAHDILLQLRQLRGDDDPLTPLRQAAQAHAAQPRVRLALANAARRLGAAPEAEKILRELLRTLGPDPTLLTSLATVLQETGSNGEALQAAQAAFAQLPDDPTAAENFVVAALAAGAHELALPVVEKFRARSSRDQRWITYRIDVAHRRHLDTQQLPGAQSMGPSPAPSESIPSPGSPPQAAPVTTSTQTTDTNTEVVVAPMRVRQPDGRVAVVPVRVRRRRKRRRRVRVVRARPAYAPGPAMGYAVPPTGFLRPTPYY